MTGWRWRASGPGPERTRPSTPRPGPASWRGRRRASAGVAASLASEAVATFDREHEAALRQAFGEADLLVPQRLSAIVVAPAATAGRGKNI